MSYDFTRGYAVFCDGGERDESKPALWLKGWDYAMEDALDYDAWLQRAASAPQPPAQRDLAD